MSTAPRRIAVVLSHPTQYYSPWFRWLQAKTPLELRVFHLWDFGIVAQKDPQFQTTFQWDIDLLSGYASELVPNIARDPGTHHVFGLRNPSLGARLSSWRPDAMLLFGYKWISHLRAIAWARLHGVPIVFRGDSHFLGRPNPRWYRMLPLRLLFRQFAAVTYVGAANRAYFERLGVSQSRLFFAPHAVDSRQFDPGRPEVHKAAATLKSQLGLSPSSRVVVFAGKLVHGKQPRELLQAFLDLARRDTALVFVGDGMEKPSLEALARHAPPNTVYFLPFANQTEMPARYLIADLFVLPSSAETWGLSINEAMHMGVPCLVSDRVGCQADLVTPGETGWVFKIDDRADLKRQLGIALDDLSSPDVRERMLRNVSARIANYTYEKAADGLLAALESLRQTP